MKAGEQGGLGIRMESTAHLDEMGQPQVLYSVYRLCLMLVVCVHEYRLTLCVCDVMYVMYVMCVCDVC